MSGRTMIKRENKVRESDLRHEREVPFLSDWVWNAYGIPKVRSSREKWK